ncbi:nuclear transport factor 2 family protein [Duganella sp. BJB1802]|uniref:nuclear transport factor 2 family protein n=1 Tax=Duganella sp. BJB1802 TaxID=2744575 RepID=UPI00159478B0|nr:nuclear transport factor 2 family protein [Duganella sp. BJB1802]NVD75015.1 nuclear transport factor 2 family protein [Duganella sp. BJB1802]
MHKLPSFVFALIIATWCAAPARAADAAHDVDVAAIRQVVQQFQSAIIAHDGKTLGGLFLPDHDSWLSVLDTPTWKSIKANNPAAPKVVRSSWKKFADYIQTSTGPVEERFYDVRIETNGAVASVYFNFDFLGNGKVTNRGSESWQMVQTGDGWKISSMLYSIGD